MVAAIFSNGFGDVSWDLILIVSESSHFGSCVKNLQIGAFHTSLIWFSLNCCFKFFKMTFLAWSPQMILAFLQRFQLVNPQSGSMVPEPWDLAIPLPVATHSWPSQHKTVDLAPKVTRKTCCREILHHPVGGWLKYVAKQNHGLNNPLNWSRLSPRCTVWYRVFLFTHFYGYFMVIWYHGYLPWYGLIHPLVIWYVLAMEKNKHNLSKVNRWAK